MRYEFWDSSALAIWDDAALLHFLDDRLAHVAWFPVNPG